MTNPWTPGPWRQSQIGYGVFDPDGKDIGGMQKIADARLIALAPEMAELLEHIDRHSRDEKDPLYWPEPCDFQWDERARDLLAKARGEA